MKIFTEFSFKKCFYKKKTLKKLPNEGFKNESNIGYNDLPYRSILDIISSDENVKLNNFDHKSNLKPPTNPPQEDYFVPVQIRRNRKLSNYFLKRFINKVFKRKSSEWKVGLENGGKKDICTSMELMEQNEIIRTHKNLEYSKPVSKQNKPSISEYRVSKTDFLLPPIISEYSSKKSFIIDLDETLVHSSFKPSKMATLRVDVNLENRDFRIYVMKRPYIDLFLRAVGPLFECILFTASLGKYADPVADNIDKSGAFQHRLFREACTFHKGSYIKDLSRLGRNLNQTVILDNFPHTYLFHPENAIPITSWYDDFSDTALKDIIPFCEALAKAPNVPDFLKRYKAPFTVTGGYDPVISSSLHKISTKRQSRRSQSTIGPLSSRLLLNNKDNISKIITQLNDLSGSHYRQNSRNE